MNYKRVSFPVGFTVLTVVYLTVEDEGGRACHVDVTVTLAPLDIERTAIHHDLRFAPGATRQSGSDSGCTGTCAASLGDAAATLPDTGAD